MKNRLKGLSNAKRVEIGKLMEAADEEIYNAGYEDGQAESAAIEKPVEYIGGVDWAAEATKVGVSVATGVLLGMNTGAIKLKEKLIASGLFRLMTANEQRAETIRQAREFVDSVKNKTHDGYIIEGRDGTEYICDAKFVHDSTKRTTTCTLIGLGTGYTRKKAVARCNPNDVFNEPLGEVISLCMALQIDIPTKFLRAIQPDDPVKGMVVDAKRKSNFVTSSYEVIRVVANRLYDVEGCGYITKGSAVIIDDTNADYASGNAGDSE